MYRMCVTALTVASCLVWQMVVAQEPEYSDADIKEKYAFISCLIHGDENGSHIRKALRMADNDTNRFARVLRELAAESTNQTKRAIRDLGLFKTPESLPFLYSYSTNAVYGAEALKSIFAIEGVTSNSVAATQRYLFMTNGISYKEEDEKSDACIDLVKKVCSDPSLISFRPAVIAMASDFQRDVELMPNALDMTLCDADASFRFSKRRLGILQRAFQRVSTDLEPVAASTCYAFQTNYLANAINELVAYPEANLPD